MFHIHFLACRGPSPTRLSGMACWGRRGATRRARALGGAGKGYDRTASTPVIEMHQHTPVVVYYSLMSRSASILRNAAGVTTTLIVWSTRGGDASVIPGLHVRSNIQGHIFGPQQLHFGGRQLP